MLENFFKKIRSSKYSKNSDSESSENAHSYTKTYQLIARDLQNPQEAVFEASAYYLCTIASLKPTEQTEILQIMRAYLAPKNIPEKRRKYIEKLLNLNNLS